MSGKEKAVNHLNKKALHRDIQKCFSKSKGRFFSILCLVAIGSFALVGLQVAGPDMRKTGENYFNKLHLADVSVIGDYGIDPENKAAINRVSGADKMSYLPVPMKASAYSHKQTAFLNTS